MAKENIKTKDDLVKELEEKDKLLYDKEKIISELRKDVEELEKGNLKQKDPALKLSDEDKALANEVWNEIKQYNKEGMFPHRIVKKVDKKFNVDTKRKNTKDEIAFYQAKGSVISFAISGVEFCYRGER